MAPLLGSRRTALLSVQPLNAPLAGIEHLGSATGRAAGAPSRSYVGAWLTVSRPVDGIRAGARSSGNELPGDRGFDCSKDRLIWRSFRPVADYPAARCEALEAFSPTTPGVPCPASWLVLADGLQQPAGGDALPRDAREDRARWFSSRRHPMVLGLGPTGLCQFGV